MALAERQDTPINDLDDVLRYLTVDLGYRKGVAVFMMNERYKDGQLRLEKQDLIRDGEPYGSWIAIDAEFGHIEPDHRGVRFVSRIKLWRKARYRIAKGCDVRAIWPLHPPASETAPERLPEDKAASAGQFPQEPLTSKEWLDLEIDRRKKLDKIPETITKIPETITEFSVELHSEMKDAVKAGVVKGVIVPRTIEQHLRDTTKLFLKKKRSPKS